MKIEHSSYVKGGYHESITEGFNEKNYRSIIC